MQIRVKDVYDDGEILAQLAEECSELAQAALKLRRAMGTVNPPRITMAEAINKLNEEWADVLVCIDELDGFVNDGLVHQIAEYKKKRWIDSIKGLS